MSFMTSGAIFKRGAGMGNAGQNAQRLWSFLTILFGAASLISITQHVLQVGLTPALATFLDWLRIIPSMMFVLPLKLFGIDIPGWLADLWTLSFVGALAMSFAPARLAYEDGIVGKPPADPWAKRLGTVMVGFSFIGLLLVVGAVLTTLDPLFTSRENDTSSPRELAFASQASRLLNKPFSAQGLRRVMRSVTRNVWLVVLTVVIFYTVNGGVGLVDVD